MKKGRYLPFQRSSNFAYAIGFRRCFARHDDESGKKVSPHGKPSRCIESLILFVDYLMQPEYGEGSVDRDIRQARACRCVIPKTTYIRSMMDALFGIC